MMDIRIYQINHDRDKNRVAFEDLEQLTKLQEKDTPDSGIYDRVYEGSVNCGSLEDAFEMFNCDRPDGFKGHSLSVSDVVEVKSADNVKPGFYFCDSIGFKEVPFEPEKTKESQGTIRVVLMEPGKLARVADIDPSLEGLQKIVGGMIEAYYPFEEQVCIICNDEGKINGMALNRAVYGDNKEMLDIIAGPAFICDCRTEDFASLSDEQLSRYQKQFQYPERFYRMGNDITAVPYKPMIKNQER